jgi:hypothetical protein
MMVNVLMDVISVMDKLIVSTNQMKPPVVSIHKDWLIDWLIVFNANFSNISAISLFIKIIWNYVKIEKNSDGQHFYQYLQNEQQSLTWNHWTPKDHKIWCRKIQVLAWDRHNKYGYI